MSGTLKAVSCVAFFFILAAMAAHVVGYITNFWIVGDDDIGPVKHVNLGLWKYELEYQNGTMATSTEDSPLNLLEEQSMILAIAGLNTFFCLVVVIKAIHVCVGILAFIVMTLMLLCAFFAHENTKSRLDSIQDIRDDWPVLELQWSFYLVFVGLIVNICATAVFLTLVLFRGERKASRSSKGLGPGPSQDDKSRLVSVVSEEKYVYDNLTTERSAPDGAYASLSYSFPDSSAPTEDDKIVASDNSGGPHESFSLDNCYNSKDRNGTGLHSNQADNNLSNQAISTIAESVRL